MSGEMLFGPVAALLVRFVARFADFLAAVASPVSEEGVTRWVVGLRGESEERRLAMQKTLLKQVHASLLPLTGACKRRDIAARERRHR